MGATLASASKSLKGLSPSTKAGITQGLGSLPGNLAQSQPQPMSSGGGYASAPLPVIAPPTDYLAALNNNAFFGG